MDVKQRARQHKYDSRPENKARKAIKAREWYLKNREHQIQYGRKYRAENADERNRKERENRRHLRMEVLLAYGGKCSCCEEWRYEFLTMHHINEDGAEHRKSIKYGNMYEWIKNHNLPAIFRVLCWNCNISLAKYGVCPHRATP